MSQTVLNHLIPQLAVEEDKLTYLYDDVTGKRFVKGMTLVGNLTIAIGVNLMEGFDAEEVIWVSTHRAQKKIDELVVFSWYTAQDEVRQCALADIAFNLGVNGLLHWPHFLSYMSDKNYPAAYKEIVGNSVWVGQVHLERAQRIEGMILTGQWPGDIHV